MGTVRLSNSQARRAGIKGEKRSKYGAKPCFIDGHRFASLEEGKRYGELMLLVALGSIHSLRLQQRVRLDVLGQKICVYIADFVYFDVKSQKEIWEDVKGVRTPVYKLKKKLVKAIHGVEIQEL